MGPSGDLLLLGPSTLHVVISAQFYGFILRKEFRFFSSALFSDHPEKGCCQITKSNMLSLSVSKNMALHRDYLWLEVKVSLLLVAELGDLISYTVDNKICYIFYLMLIFFSSGPHHCPH